MSRFFDDAIRIFETAAQGSTNDLSILVDSSGALRIVPAAGWRTDALQEHYGAREVFQVSHGPAGIRLEARSGPYSCVLHRAATEGSSGWSVSRKRIGIR